MDQAELAVALSELDFKIVIDKSGSMGEEDMGGRSRWDYMQETAVAFARDLAKIDSDGLGVVLFSGTGLVTKDGCTAEDIKELFANNRPAGSTPLHLALEAALKLNKTSGKRQFIVVFTDGTPDNGNSVAELIKRQANSQTADNECTFLFIQVGYDKAASKYLKMLDDDLKGAKFDIVDAKTIDEAEKFTSTLELIAHAIDD